jgi:hypothetical protein
MGEKGKVGEGGEIPSHIVGKKVKYQVISWGGTEREKKGEGKVKRKRKLNKK